MTPVTATREGGVLVLRLPQYDPDSPAGLAAQRVAFDPAAPMLDRVAASVAAGVLRPAVAEAMIRDSAALRADALALLELATAPPLAGPVVELRVPLGRL